MKNKILAVLLLATSLGISCNKKFDQSPSNAIPVEEAFNTVTDFSTATLGMYYQMTRTTNYLGGSDASIAWVSTLDLLADNLISQQTGRGSQRTFGNWQYNASNTTGMFGDAYKVIRAANGILEHIENLGDLPERANFEGEALAARAMAHFDLLRVYSKPVSGPQADLNASGIPYVTTTNIEDKPGRGTVKESYEKIVADLEMAVTLINNNNGSGRLNKAAVYGLLSRVYLYGGEWQKSADAATACLAVNSNPGRISTFPGIWTDANETGVLFKLKIATKDRITIGVGYSQTSADGQVRSEWVASHSLALMYDTANDVRAKAYLTKAKFSGLEYMAVIKYKGRPGSTPNTVDIKYLRVAEILLNRAEAYTMLAMDAEARTDLDSLRQNRYKNFTAGTETGEALKTAIAKERRLELAFEGDRWFDLKRKGLPVARDEFGDQADGSGAKYFVRDLPANDNRWLIPLAQSYINANPNLTQNPGF